ncbi:Hypothetical_protein [Hexamita inflata]|uniref:Hypothetical_protein n=1 Tax=Hexamita inflata TaxID=28002 RepID=A0AA86TER5_9EUKA|nr:Hypothetical protein HINF_LOCUS3311 [Hexamita inflata]CAI9915670.1 Hypothetical protein HINF_LOCUS3315 [Hexamita inflata]
MQQVSQFAVFGFNTQKQDILDSDIFVTINYSILIGALICMQCNIVIKKSQLQFVAYGVQISALILQSINTVQVSKVNISFRFRSNFSSGLVNHVNQSISSFTISESILTGFNNFTSESNGYICSKLSVDIQVEINQFQVCAENTLRFGYSLFSATITGSETLKCADLCDSNCFVTYGLCMLQPAFSTLLLNTTVVCEYPFIFNFVLNTCECDFGFYLNVTLCVNVVQQFSIIQKNITNLEISLKDEIQRTEIELKTSFIGLEELIINNLTALTQNMNDNDKTIIDNLVIMNNTVHNNIDKMKIQNEIEFKTVTNLIETKQIQTINYLTNVNNNLKNIIDAQSAQIADNQLNMKNNFTAVMNIVATQSYVKDVYNNLISAVNAIAVAQNPCKEWPGSVNENGLCRCAYLGQAHYCQKFESCCSIDWSHTSNSTSTTNKNRYDYNITCINGATRKGYGSDAETASIAYKIIDNVCGGSKYYLNL